MAKIALRAYYREIEDLIEEGQIEEAVTHCKHILRTLPKHIPTYQLLGRAYLESQSYGDAADILQRVLSAIPDDFLSNVGMSMIREDEANLDSAIWHMERAFEVQPANQAIQDELRRLYGKRDGLEPPKIRLTRGALARMYANGDLYDQAIAEIRIALSEDPKRPDLQNLLAEMYFQAGLTVEAAETCTQILSKFPYSLTANKLMVQILRQTERAAEAEIYARRVRSLDPQTMESISTGEQVISIDRLRYTPGMSFDEDETQDDWAADLREAASEESIPDWLSEPDQEAPSFAPSEPSAPSQSDVDWSNFRDEAQTAQLDMADQKAQADVDPLDFFPDERPAPDPDLPSADSAPDWLSELDSTPAKGGIPPVSIDDEGITTDWLNQVEEKLQDSSEDADKIPEWLQKAQEEDFDAEPDSPGTPPAAPKAAITTAWLNEMSDVFDDDSGEDKLPDFLDQVESGSLDQDKRSTVDLGTSKESIPQSGQGITTDWLSEMSDVFDEDSPDDKLPDFLDQVESGSLEQDERSTVDFGTSKDSIPQSGQGITTDWLSEMSDVFDDDAKAENVPDFLAKLESGQLAAEDAQIETAQQSEPAPEETLPAISEPGDDLAGPAAGAGITTDWLSEMSDVFDDDTEAENLPEFLEKLESGQLAAEEAAQMEAPKPAQEPQTPLETPAEPEAEPLPAPPDPTDNLAGPAAGAGITTDWLSEMSDIFGDEPADDKLPDFLDSIESGGLIDTHNAPTQDLEAAKEEFESKGFDTSADSIPSPGEAPGITTAWLNDMDGIFSDESEDAGIVPNWLDAAETDSLADIKPKQELLDADKVDEDLITQDVTPDWLKTIEVESGTDLTEAPPPVEEDETPSWLKSLNVDDPGSGPLPPEMAEEPGPDWIKEFEDDKGKEDTEVPAPVVSGEDTIISKQRLDEIEPETAPSVSAEKEEAVDENWMSRFDEPAQEAEEVPDWINDLKTDEKASIEDTIISTRPPETSEPDTVPRQTYEIPEIDQTKEPEWLGELDEETEATTADALLEARKLSKDTTDWLTELGFTRVEDEEESQPREEAAKLDASDTLVHEEETPTEPDWLNELDESEAQEEIPEVAKEESSEGTGITAWLEEFGEEEKVIEEEGPAPTMQPNPLDGTDWLKEFEEEEDQVEQEATSAATIQPNPLDGTDWLKEFDEEEDQEELDLEPPPPGVPASEKLDTDWLNEYTEERVKPSGSLETPEAKGDDPGLMDWLDEFGDEEETPDPLSTQEIVGEQQMPDWLESLQQDETEAKEEAEAGVEEEEPEPLSGAETPEKLPDWMDEFKQAESDQKSISTGSLPEWLQETDESPDDVAKAKEQALSAQDIEWLEELDDVITGSLEGKEAEKPAPEAYDTIRITDFEGLPDDETAMPQAESEPETEPEPEEPPQPSIPAQRKSVTEWLTEFEIREADDYLQAEEETKQVEPSTADELPEPETIEPEIQAELLEAEQAEETGLEADEELPAFEEPFTTAQALGETISMETELPPLEETIQFDFEEELEIPPSEHEEEPVQAELPRLEWVPEDVAEEQAEPVSEPEFEAEPSTPDWLPEPEAFAEDDSADEDVLSWLAAKASEEIRPDTSDEEVDIQIDETLATVEIPEPVFEEIVVTETEAEEAEQISDAIEEIDELLGTVSEMEEPQASPEPVFKEAAAEGEAPEETPESADDQIQYKVGYEIVDVSEEETEEEVIAEAPADEMVESAEEVEEDVIPEAPADEMTEETSEEAEEEVIAEDPADEMTEEAAEEVEEEVIAEAPADEMTEEAAEEAEEEVIAEAPADEMTEETAEEAEEEVIAEAPADEMTEEAAEEAEEEVIAETPADEMTEEPSEEAEEEIVAEVPADETVEAVEKEEKSAPKPRRKTKSSSLTKAREFQARDQVEEALKEYNKLIRRKRHLQEIILDLEELHQKYIKNIDILQLTGDAYLQMDELQQALDYYTRAEQLLD